MSINPGEESQSCMRRSSVLSGSDVVTFVVGGRGEKEDEYSITGASEED
jgi:hypothetical protein